MEKKLEKNLIELSKSLKKPIYAVGGIVRNYLLSGEFTGDVDICGTISVEELAPKLEKFNFKLVAEYKRTGTVVFKGKENTYEYTAFRKEVYKEGGEHTPIFTEFTEDICEDALRRDFKCNAVYLNLSDMTIADVLGGVQDIKNRVLSTVDSPEKVFKSDGLRLLRLARFAGELNFTPAKEVLSAMARFKDNVLDISKERIYSELNKILVCDTKYSFSDPKGHYTAIKILEKTGVLDNILPELTMGRGMVQRADYHNYDVLEHSLKTLLYAPQSIRWQALLHDVGKPYALKKDGNFYFHNVYGEQIAIDCLKRLKADNKTIKLTKFLVKEHMLDIDCKMKEGKLKKFIVQNFSNIEALLQLKQADFMACKDSFEIAPTVEKWKKLIDKMHQENTPFSVKELKVSANEIISLGFVKERTGKALNKLLELVLLEQVENSNQKLKEALKKLKF